jgi:ABC-2 type transport system permease protein
MFKRIINLMQQDLTNTLRDNILLYGMFGPLLLAIGARLFLPSLDQASLTIAVQASAGPAIIQRLEQIGVVETYSDIEGVRERVLRTDDVPGIILVNQEPVLVLEGNEAEGVEALSSLFGQILSGEPVAEHSLTQLASGRSLVTEYATIIFIMIVMLIGSLIMAFNIIEDKETRALQALGVSPLSMVELSLARGLFSLLVSLVLVILVAAILVGTQINYGLLVIGFLFSMGLAILTGYIIGGFSDSQLKAIAILKFYMMIYLVLPVMTIFLPRQWHAFFFILPNYWVFQTYENVIIGQTGGLNLWGAGSIAFLSSLALILALLPVLRRQLKLR